WLGPVSSAVAQFLSNFEQQLANCGDHGLLLVALAGEEGSRAAAERSLARLERAVSHGDAARGLDMQQLAWMLWGASAWAAQPRAQQLAERIFELIRRDFVHPHTGLPRHSPRRYRAHTVSFGSVVYFLRAMHEYGETFASADARELFNTCLRRVLALQGEDGAWPWLLDVRTALPIDVYPIFTVHQDSMAMLFLFPAREQGLDGVEQVIERSFRWNLGVNELHSSIVLDEPYAWFYRSIERAERWPRARRYLRGLGPRASAYPPRSPHVRFNRECRSYHPGWILYVWSAHAQTPSLPAQRARQGLADESASRALR
ncbi:MAG TPA: hypothetical protein VED41_12060, partial [Solirubrobacteraceae bacterium]|nr:hypothetical protein [Solirubrobacteraceae bacterium]